VAKTIDIQHARLPEARLLPAARPRGLAGCTRRCPVRQRGRIRPVCVASVARNMADERLDHHYAMVSANVCTARNTSWHRTRSSQPIAGTEPRHRALFCSPLVDMIQEGVICHRLWPLTQSVPRKLKG